MGDVISLTDRRERRAAATTPCAGVAGAVDFAFDLASPYTYFAAERIDRLFGAVTWVPALGEPDADGAACDRGAAQARADALRMPLVWPDRAPASSVAAMRVAVHAAEQSRAPAFVLAASRLAFCGGFDLDDPEILAEACAAAGLPLDEALRAAGDRTLDDALRDAGRRFADAGAGVLPALKVGGRLYAGEHRVAEAAAAFRAHQPRSRGAG